MKTDRPWVTALRKNLERTTLIFAIGLLLGATTAWAQAPDPDLNNDGLVNILELSLVGRCFGADLATNPQCLETWNDSFLLGVCPTLARKFYIRYVFLAIIT